MPKPIKIGGPDLPLEKHLNDTAADHNGHGYDDWRQEIDSQRELDGQINKSRLARFMFVGRRETIEKWLTVDPKEVA